MIKVKSLYVAYAFLILFAYVQPIEFPAIEAEGSNSGLEAQFLSVLSYVGFPIEFVFAIGLPIFPLLCVIITKFQRRPHLSSHTAITLAAATGVLGILASLLNVMLTSINSALIVFAHGCTLTFALVTAVLYLVSGTCGRAVKAFFIVSVSISTVAAIWSLGAGVMALYQSNRLAEGAPKCFASHSPPGELHSFWALRGFTFYTSDTGYKSTSNWYFHGILIIDDGNRTYYNWSPRALSFHKIENPSVFTANIVGLCEPK